MVIKYLVAGLLGICVGLALTYPTIFLCKKLKVSQTTLHYVEKHSMKSGTPTMGGFIFIFASLLVYSCLFYDGGWYGWLTLLITLGYGLLGFLDDFIKIHFHQNEGLKPYQKIVGQLGLALIVALYVYFKVGTSLDFFGLKLDLGVFIIPFIVFVYLATTNSVNLTDGLDGLAGGVSVIYLLVFGVIIALMGTDQMNNLALACFAMVGGLVGFLAVNVYPAKIFMGDTGSLALGGFITTVSCLSGKELLIPIIGMMFMLSAISDIIQVLHYKRTKRRVFLMAPLHHHFEKKGVHENRIVAIYIIITLVLGLACLALEVAL